MSPVSSSTLTCGVGEVPADARGRPRSRAAVGGASCSARPPRRPPPRPRRRRPRRASARRRRDRATASPRATAAGSPCAAGDPRTRREIEVAQRRVAVEDDAVHLPALALVPVGARVDRHPRLDEHARCSSTSVLSVTPQWRRGRLHVREHLEAAVGAGGAVRHLLRLHRRRRVAAVLVALASARAASRCRRRTRGSRSRGSRLATSAAWRHASRRTRTTSVPNAGACSSDRVAELGLEPREQLGVALVERVRVGRGSSTASAPRASAASASVGRRCRSRQSTTIGSPRQRCASSSLPMPSFWIRSWSSTMPWSSASGRGGHPGT